MFKSFVKYSFLFVTLSLNAISGKLIIPETISARPLPVVITLTGSNGGISKPRAQALADHGFAALALAYFNYEDLPEKLCEIPLEYFEEAFAYIKDHPDLDENRVAVHGISRGGELALILGSWFPDKFKAIIATAPSNVIIGTREGLPAWTYHGKELAPPAYVDPDCSGGEDRAHPVRTREKFLKAPYCEESAIPVERITAPLLLITGGDDGVWPAELFVEEIKKRMETYHLLHYPTAGHGINIPTSDAAEPLYFHPTAHKWFDCGGSQIDNQFASQDSWEYIINFLREELSL